MVDPASFNSDADLIRRRSDKCQTHRLKRSDRCHGDRGIRVFVTGSPLEPDDPTADVSAFATWSGAARSCDVAMLRGEWP
jgi:hypothetical protein